MKILAIIPARGGSKGVPGKNIKLLGGKPLLQYTIDVALESDLLDKVVLSSDDTEIIEFGKKMGAEVPFVRPDNLAEDTTSTLDVIKHCLNYYSEKDEIYDVVCLLQPTSPFRSVGFLNEAIKTFICKETDSLISVQKVPYEYNPHWTFEEDENGILKIATGEKQIISRRQDLPKTFHRDGSIYLTKVKTILEQNSLYGNSVSYLESPKEFYMNIDTLEDWKLAETKVKGFMESNDKNA
jgi:CMP-N,N'-diacetyllegionaminic acid synthase